MAVTYHIDTTKRLVTLSYVDDTSFDEFRRTMNQVFADRKYERGFSFLTDRSTVEAPTSDYIRRVSEYLLSHAEAMAGARWATVVASVAGYGMGRMAQTLAADLPVEVAVFTDLGSARAWLERP